ncbi:MAG TPA: class I SAM-dependent methyltransferase [Baekduia sp.]|uniref:class I SAM-dependent methyltransferase n=1 Tax=Baekduia sp. TaxID=2600305 RepID=UPI002CAF7300|nr:class I SAM-dependent methyltransferase [Baekduia sp.]HMJ36841.1 class I SAM-dependent methyltransferase [Baekduia sp.]
MSPAPATAEEIRDVNARYHDGAAADYDAKWGIDFGEIGRTQVLGKLRKALDGRLRSFERGLELGAGTGYFSLNLLQAGVITDATCTDISPGMVDTLAANAQRLGLDVDARVADAEALPFDDESFDLVLGHAVLHHLPDLDQAWREIHRVLRPGGVAVFAGEPSHYGDRIASVPKRAATHAAPAWRRIMRAHPAREGHQDGGAANHQLESKVDVHAFTPEQLSAGARAADFGDVRVRGEELLANWFGWANRALEATADPETVPWAWKMYAFRGYVGLQHLDRVLLEPRLPPAMFYNLMITAEKAPA